METKRKHKRPKIHHRRAMRVATGSAKAEINITPLVDVVLVLLIIFMVITPMLHRGVKIELPETAHHEKKQDTGEQLVVSIRGDGVYIETDKLEGERLMEKLRTELKTASRPVHVRADREQIRQVGLNLAVNALDAMEEGGELCVRWRDEDGEQVAVEFVDDGPGIDAEVLNRIGQPFFTTKERGTGLGVAIAQRIVERHGGALTYERADGHGTIARVTLPRIAAPAAVAA